MDEGTKGSGPSRRTQRMADLIRSEIANYLIKGNKNLRIGFVTITHVKMTPDLQDAKIYYTAYGSEKEILESREGLDESKGVIRSHLAKTLKLRFTPRIEFQYDEGLEKALRIESLLSDIKRTQDQE